MIVADASWIVALRDSNDAHHVEAAEINDTVVDERVLLHPVTFAECLVAPAKLGMVEDAAVALRAAFEVTEVDRDAPLRWASLRADTGLRLPDVIILDTALHHGARAIATFDEKLAARSLDRKLKIFGAPTP